MGLRSSFGHLFMVWAADDALVSYHNLVSRDLRRVHTRQPWAWGERSYSERDDPYYVGMTIRAMERLQQEGLFYPEEIANHVSCMRRDVKGNMSNSYVDSFGVPRATFGRITAMSDPMAAKGTHLEFALPTAMCMTHWNDERVPQRCDYAYGQFTAHDVIARWKPALDWMHPFKLGRSPELRQFLRELKANLKERPEEFFDFNLRDPEVIKDPRKYACH
jgi:hypothetical protein